MFCRSCQWCAKLAMPHEMAAGTPPPAAAAVSPRPAAMASLAHSINTGRLTNCYSDSHSAAGPFTGEDRSVVPLYLCCRWPMRSFQMRAGFASGSRCPFVRVGSPGLGVLARPLAGLSNLDRLRYQCVDTAADLGTEERRSGRYLGRLLPVF